MRFLVRREAGRRPDFFVSSSALSIRTPSLERVGYYVLFTLSDLLIYVLVGTPEREDVLSQALGSSCPSDFAPDVLAPVWPLSDGAIRWPPPRKSMGTKS